MARARGRLMTRAGGARGLPASQGPPRGGRGRRHRQPGARRDQPHHPPGAAVIVEAIAGAAALTAAVLAWSNRRVARTTPEPPSEVWVRRTTTVEEFRATGPGRDIAPVVFDPPYQTLRPPAPMIGTGR